MVFSNSGAILLEGADAALLVEKVFPLLDGSRTMADLVAAVPGLPTTDLEDVLRDLQDLGLLAEGLSSDDAAVYGQQRRLCLARARVVIVGAGTRVSPVAEALRAAGVGHVESVMEVDADAKDALKIGLKNLTPYDIAVCVTHSNDTGLLWDFAESTRQAGIASLTCVVDSHEAIVGPLSLPGQTACWNCSRLRLAANAEWQNLSRNPDTTAPESHALAGSLLAREVLEVLCPDQNNARLVNRFLVFNRSSLETSLHCFLGVPGCGLCGGRAEPEMWNPRTQPSTLAQGEPCSALDVLPWIVDSRAGIVNRVVVESPDITGLDLLIVANAIPADAPGESSPRRTMPMGWGKGLTPSAALMGAVGEAIERYSASLPDLSRIVWSRPGDLRGNVLDPRSFALYSEERYRQPGFPFVRFDPEVRHPWVAGEWMGTQEPVWVPAVLAYLFLEVHPEHAFCQGNSNGLAAATDRTEASLRATLELLERDAFMTSWRCKVPGQCIPISHGLDPDLADVVKGIQALGATVELILLPSISGYPTALCLAFGDGINWPGVTLGLGTDPNVHAAVRQAILELGQTGPYLRRLMQNQACTVPAAAQDVRQMLDHASYYFPAARASAFDYLRRNWSPGSLAGYPVGHSKDYPQPFSADRSQAPERSLSACSRALAASGVRVALVDVTSSEIATTPFRVMRAISPDLQGISFGYGLDREPVPRLVALGTLGEAASDLEIAPIW
jgi:ribosomal protein S12 methylthiotransferase accessory factor